MKDKGQATFLLVAIVAFVGIGIYAAIKMFHKQEKKTVEQEIAREAQELFSKITTDLQKKDVCSRTLAGHLKNDGLKKIIAPLGEDEAILYEEGKQIGRLKIDRMEIKDSFEDTEYSTINLILHLSNFSDATSKELIGLKTFKSQLELKVDDCNNYFLAGSTLNEAESKCTSPRPEGIRGKVTDIIIKESSSDSSVLLECRTCRFSGRKVITSCID